MRGGRVTAASPKPAAERVGGRLALGLAGSVLVHGGLVLLLVWRGVDAQPPPASSRAGGVVEFEVVTTAPAPPPPPEPPAVEPPSAPKPPPPPVERPQRPPPAARVEPPPAPPERTQPRVEPPPPSNDPLAGADSTAEPPPPVNVGISMRSTVGRGEGMRVGVGNTLYGRPDEVAADPTKSRAYAGGEVPRGDRALSDTRSFVPPHQVTTLPRLRREVRAEYPEEARRQEIEGRVVLEIEVDADGNVTGAVPIDGPGHGLAEAAVEAARRFRFHPATVDGNPVATRIRYVYTFILD